LKVNSPFASSKAQPTDPAAVNFSVQSALISYLAAVVTFVTLVIVLGIIVSGQLPTVRGHWLLWPYALVTSVAVAVISGRRSRRSLLGATWVGVLGGLSLLAITSAAALLFGILWRAV
jgi:hypothetical protein